MTNVIYLETSVLLRAIREQSCATRCWLVAQEQAGATFVASRLTRVEAIRVAKRAQIPVLLVEEYLAALALLEITADICKAAEAFTANLSGADALHLATALTLPPGATLATHDRELAAAARGLLAVVDPVIDDPHCPPVAPRGGKPDGGDRKKQ